MERDPSSLLAAIKDIVFVFELFRVKRPMAIVLTHEQYVELMNTPGVTHECVENSESIMKIDGITIIDGEV